MGIANWFFGDGWRVVTLVMGGTGIVAAWWAVGMRLPRRPRSARHNALCATLSRKAGARSAFQVTEEAGERAAGPVSAPISEIQRRWGIEGDESDVDVCERMHAAVAALTAERDALRQRLRVALQRAKRAEDLLARDTVEWDPCAPIDELPVDVRRDIASERGLAPPGRGPSEGGC